MKDISGATAAMTGDEDRIRTLLDRVRARWRRVLFLQAAGRSALATTGILAVGLAIAAWLGRSPVWLASLLLFDVLAIALAWVWGCWPARSRPDAARAARFVEERVPSLDDRLVSAVHVLSADPAARPVLAPAMIADAAARAAAIDPSAVVPREQVRRAAFQAAAAFLLLMALVGVGRHLLLRSVDAVVMLAFPDRMELKVTPGNARLVAGSPLTIEARLSSKRGRESQAPVIARVLRSGGGDGGSDGARSAGDPAPWQETEMSADASGLFSLQIEAVDAPFEYRVVAGALTSGTFGVTVARPPRVTQIDIEYVYPASLGLAPRTDRDGGDIYAPSGTDVRVHVHTQGGASGGELALAAGPPVTLAPGKDGVLTGGMKVVADGSYRVGVTAPDGLRASGDTEYFIRIVEDRPPDVRVLEPARDRQVTALEEVDIEAQADDDFGVERLELVYAVRGGEERVTPLPIARRAPSVNGRHTLYLEDMKVRPGDFLSYYLRARDVPRGRSSSEGRSDIFFLEVKPFEQEFTLAQSSASGGGSNSRTVDELVAAQKEVIVATWKLDRRSQATRARSNHDVLAVAKAEAELKGRVEEASSAFRGSQLRDPRRRSPQPGGVRAGQTLPEEDAMTLAASAMGSAVTFLEKLSTRDAIPREMEALNHLLRAQAEVKKRQVTRQQAGGGSGSNRSTQDLSTLFDRELQRQQQTNYEQPGGADRRKDDSASMLDQIKELARRQDELLRRQQDLARQRERMSDEALKRALERLTRDQNELRERAEEMARTMSGGEPSGSPQQGRQGGAQSNEPGKDRRGQSDGRSPGQQGQTSGSPGNGRGSARGSEQGQRAGRQMREVSEAMRAAANGLQRQDSTQASASGSRALDALRQLERQLQPGAPDERRRALGDLQLEARQMAEAQRQIASELAKAGRDRAPADTMRRLAGEQDRLAERGRRAQESLRQQAAASGARDAVGSPSGKNTGASRQGMADASRDIERQRVAERMQQAAAEMRAAAGQRGDPSARASHGRPDADRPDGADSKTAAGADLGRTAAAQEDLARALDSLADRLAAVQRAEAARDPEQRKLADQLSRVEELRSRLDRLARELDSLKEARAGGTDLARVRDEYARQMRETRELMEQLRRDDEGLRNSGPGFTFEGQGMVLSAPGTEAFKQDFAAWEVLRRQSTVLLDRAASSLAQKLSAQEARDRLAAGLDEKTPAAYQQQVDSYFKAIASKK